MKDILCAVIVSGVKILHYTQSPKYCVVHALPAKVQNQIGSNEYSDNDAPSHVLLLFTTGMSMFTYTCVCSVDVVI